MNKNPDTQGDIYEYLLSELKTSGKNGQFRTPRHIIKMMCELVGIKVGQTVCDPACGTGGFLIGAYQHILKQYTSPELITVNEEGVEHGLIGAKITSQKTWNYLRNKTFYGFDFDSTMLRISAMNMVLHGIKNPNIKYLDSISKNNKEENLYDVILANPPFKGNIDKNDIHEALSRTVKTTRTELLFVAQMIRLLKIGGQCAVIVPNGVLFRSDKAHIAIRKKIIEEAQLEAVISMPSGVFKPYAGVSTAILLFTKGGETDKVWFYDMTADGFSLDDKRDKVKENDIPDIIAKWNNRHKLKEPVKEDNWFFVDKKKIVESGDYSLNGRIYKENLDYSHSKWPMVELGKVCVFVRGPFGGSLKKAIFKPSGHLVYEQYHAINNDFNFARYFIDKKKFNEMQRFEVFPGDLLISCLGTMGKVAIVPEQYKKGIINQALLKLTPHKNRLSCKYLQLVLQSNFIQKKHFRDQPGSSIKNASSVKKLKQIKIPLPPLEVQKEILEGIEKEKAHIESCKELIKINTKKIQQKINEIWGTV